MVLTISPADAQAIQEDEVQLLMAIAQAARGIAITVGNGYRLATANPSEEHHEPDESLKIQIGRRLVYGQMARGEFRNELTSESIKAIASAIQKPVDEGVDPSRYRNKVPAIEISQGDLVLFRQEGDGVVTVNQIRLELEREANHPSSGVEEVIKSADAGASTFQTNGYHPENGTNGGTRTSGAAEWSPNDIARAAEYLINPLGSEKPIYDSVSIGGYGITAKDDQLTVTREDATILVVQDGVVTSNQANRQDWEFFRRTYQQSTSQSVPERWMQLELSNGHARNGHHRSAEEHEQNGWRSNGTHLEELQTIPAAIAITNQEAAKLNNGATRELLEDTAHHWGQQTPDRARDQLQQGAGWLASRPEAWRNGQVARAALELFNRGHQRTGEQSYQVGEYTVSAKGHNAYVLKDTQGELMRFQATESPIPGMGQQRVQVTSVSDRLNDFKSRELRSLQRNPSVTPQGDQDVEANYAAKLDSVETTVILFLQNHVEGKVWDREGGRFKFEMSDEGTLRITDKQEGRGVVFRRQNGKVFSRLNTGDFAHFERLRTRMLEIAKRPVAQQPQPRARKRDFGLEIS
ncbi:MAG: hypothetical protein ACFB8W_13635 [Elainellaceae cyanobacterium]